jgi:hypothetical protein
MRELRHQLRDQAARFNIAKTNEYARAATDVRGDYGLTRREYPVAKLLVEGPQRVLSKLKVHSPAAAGAKVRS